MTYTLNTTVENNVTSYLVSDSRQNYYSISKFLYEILFEYKHTSDIEQICANINKKRVDNFITKSSVEQGLEKVNAIILENACPTPNEKKYIKYKKTIIKEGQLHNFYRLLSLLFNRKIAFLLSFTSFIISINFFLRNGFTSTTSLYNHLIVPTSIGNLIASFLLSLLIVLIHELGHATAAFKNGILPKEIGMGLYFIFPVLYTNVTNIWSLPAKKRLVVNLGGMYFQLLINIILIFAFNAGYYKNIILSLLVFNTGSIIISFNPFLRYDGYWLFCDFFGITNLKEKSHAFIKNVINCPLKIKRYICLNKIKRAIVVYSILNIAFWAWLYFSIATYLIKNISQVSSLLFIKYVFTFQSITTFVSCFLIIVWILVAIKTIFITLFKHNYHAKQQFNLPK